MSHLVVVLHANGEDTLAERLAKSIRGFGYEVWHTGNVLVGEQIYAELSTRLLRNGPVVICGTAKAVGSKWVKTVLAAVNIPGMTPPVRVFPVQMDSDADFSIFSFQQVTVAQCYPSFETGIDQLQTALTKYFPIPNPGLVRGKEVVIDGEQPNQSFDSWLAGISEFSVDLLSKYRNALRLQIRELLLQDDLSEAEFLVRAGLMSSGRLFAPGVLLFYDYPHILAPSAFTQCVQYGGKNRSASQDSNDCIGPLLYQIDQAMRFIESRIQKVEVLVPGIVAARIEYQYPMICFREVLANALCHRDYSDREQHIHVRLFSDRIEVVSPGSWILTDLEKGIKHELAKLESDHS